MMDFRLVIDTTVATLKPLIRPDWTLIILRDVEGKVRIVADAPAPGLPPSAQPDDTECTEIESRLRSAIGGWLGSLTPVWRVPAGKRHKNKPTTIDHILNAIMAMWRPIDLGSSVHGRLYLVERHVGHEAWTGDSPYDPPWSREEVKLGNAPPIITFFSHKGGVGRSTALVATAANLTRAGKNVLVLDLDLEAPGLDALFNGLVSTAHDAAPELGVLDLLMLPSVDDQALERACGRASDAVLGGGGGMLWVLPAGKVDDQFMEQLARLDVAAGGDRDGLLQRLRTLFQSIKVKFGLLDYILVDARAGFHDLGGVMLASLSHGAVMVITASPQSEHGLRRVAGLLGSSGGSSEGPLPLILAHGMAPERGSELLEEEQRGVREKAYKLLLDARYYGAQVPPEEQEGLAHDPITLYWTGPLRGKGGPLAKNVVTLLCDRPYTDLTERLTALFPR